MNQRQPNQPIPVPPPQAWQVDPDRLRWTPVYQQAPETPPTVAQLQVWPSAEPARSKSPWIRLLVVALMLLAALLIGLVFQQPIQRLMAAMGSIGSGAPADTQTVGLIAFGLILVLIVSIVRILTPTNQR